MPELPEVETTRLGLAKYLQDQTIERVIVRQPRLRQMIPAATLRRSLPGEHIKSFERRAKYLLLRCAKGSLLVHLGMSGSLRLLSADTPAGKHDHFDLVLKNGQCLRLRDPRRFGLVLWTTSDPMQHALLAKLGPEPLGDDFDGPYLARCLRGSRRRIRDVLLDGEVVVGVGNIYANEALFMASIRPQRRAGTLSRARIIVLTEGIKAVLQRAIKAGGTTLRDYTTVEGQPGYFRTQLSVYGRAGEACQHCEQPIKRLKVGGRSLYYCPQCQR